MQILTDFRRLLKGHSIDELVESAYSRGLPVNVVFISECIPGASGGWFANGRTIYSVGTTAEVVTRRDMRIVRKLPFIEQLSVIEEDKISACEEIISRLRARAKEDVEYFKKEGLAVAIYDLKP